MATCLTPGSSPTASKAESSAGKSPSTEYKVTIGPFVRPVDFGSSLAGRVSPVLEATQSAKFQISPNGCTSSLTPHISCGLNSRTESYEKDVSLEEMVDWESPKLSSLSKVRVVRGFELPVPHVEESEDLPLEIPPGVHGIPTSTKPVRSVLYLMQTEWNSSNV